MSVVLIALADDQAVIASDGAVKLVRPDGTTESRHITNCQKFRVLSSDIVIAITGSSWLAEDRVYPTVERFLTQRYPAAATFREVSDFLSSRIREWDSERAALFGDWPNSTNGYCMALAGIDRESNKARCVMWASTPEAPFPPHAPCEVPGAVAVFGAED